MAAKVAHVTSDHTIGTPRNQLAIFKKIRHPGNADDHDARQSVH